MAPLALLAAALLGAGPTVQPAAGPRPDPAERLSFGDLFVPSPRELRPSPRLRSLDGRRVRLAGFMVRMEEPPRGAFYLASRPVDCDESGAGTGDLPPDAVRVVVRASAGEAVPWAPGPVEVTGRLELGPQADQDGRVSSIRIVLDPGEPGPAHLSQPDAGGSRVPTHPKEES